MYEAFYGLKERPFNLTPDPKYLYLSDKHKEAFAHLLFGIKNRSGFVMVTGEIGTGKTTICRNLLNQIDPDTKVAFIFNPPLNPVELLKKINVEFGISSAPDNVLELTELLNTFLLDQAAQNHSCVLVIDEAQNLSPQVLEQTRLLSNLETEKDKLLQIVLIGQPELGEKLALHELRQLNQRITARYHLKALSEKETLQYIAYRLHVAGGRRKIQFTKAAAKKIYALSGGTPRVINAICDRALLIGYTKEAVNLSASIVKQAASEIRGEKVVVHRSWGALLKQLVPSPSVALVGAIVILAMWYFGQSAGRVADQMGRFNDVILPPQATPAPANAVEAKAEPVNDAAAELRRQEEIRAEVAKAIAAKIAPGTTVLNTDADSPKALTDALASAMPEAIAVGAAEALLAAWQAPAGSEPLTEADAAGVQAYFAKLGFSVESLVPGLEQLVSINLPSLVRVKQGPKEYWVALLGVKNGQARLALAKDNTVEVPVGALKSVYLAEAVLPWRDPDPRAPALGVGRGGKPVADLKAQLRQLGRLDANDRDEQYDQDVARAVSRIQAETGLTIDGVAGRQMRMVMSAWTGAPGFPRLDGTSLAAAAPAPTNVAAEKPATKPVAKAAAKKPSEAPLSTPLPTPEQLGKALEKAATEKTAPAPDALVKVGELPKLPEAPAAENTTPEAPAEKPATTAPAAPTS